MWQRGDRALCIRSGTQTRSGTVYTVARVIEHGELIDTARNSHPRGLRFFEIPKLENWFSDASRFIKIEPENQVHSLTTEELA